MKKILLIATTLLANINGASAVTTGDLAKCVNAFSGQTNFKNFGYTTILTPTKNAGNQLLVLNNEGAKIVAPQTQDQVFVFQAPGATETIKQQWLLENNTVAPTWDYQESSSSKLSKNNSIKIDEAIRLATDGLKLSVTQKNANLQADLEKLDRWVRLRQTGDGEKDVLSSASKKVINEERLYSQLLLVEKGLEDLNSCKNISDPKIQELAKIESARLMAFKNKIGDLKRESKKFSKCVSKISANNTGTSSFTNSSPQGAR